MNKQLLKDFKTYNMRIEDFFETPCLIPLTPDGLIEIDKSLPDLVQLDEISTKLPAPSNFSELDEKERNEARALYQCLCVFHVYPAFRYRLERLVTNKIKFKGSELRQDLIGLGTPVSLIVSSASRRISLQQTTIQQWGKYDLQFEEVTSLEHCAGLRREINVRRANGETSVEYQKAKSSVKALKEEEFENELRQVTNTLGKIMHMGMNYLTIFERDRIREETTEMERKMRDSFIENRLIKLRKSYLQEGRKDPDKFKMPKTKS